VPICIRKAHPRRTSARLLRRAVKKTLAAEGIADRSVEVSMALVDDATIRGLNARYRGHDTPTDVLAFGMAQDIALPGIPRMLGDVVISIDTALRQAHAGGRSLDEEVAHLAIHGVLHLLGYDDATHEAYAEMVRKGDAVWRAVQADDDQDTGAPSRHQPDGE